jgi:hypothetical protein
LFANWRTHFLSYTTILCWNVDFVKRILHKNQVTNVRINGNGEGVEEEEIQFKKKNHFRILIHFLEGVVGPKELFKKKITMKRMGM